MNCWKARNIQHIDNFKHRMFWVLLLDQIFCFENYPFCWVYPESDKKMNGDIHTVCGEGMIA